ncbi:energy transducer TonB [Sphingomonas sp. NCPPB 2930]
MTSTATNTAIAPPEAPSGAPSTAWMSFLPSCGEPRGLALRTQLVLVLIALAIHGAFVWLMNQRHERVRPPQPHEIAIEFAAPPPPPPMPPPTIAPAPVEAPPPIDDLAVKPPPARLSARPRPRPAPAPTPHPPPPQPPSPPLAAPQEAPPSPPPDKPPVPSAAPIAAPTAPKETPAVSGIALLGNPSPPYPALALRRMWEGKVVLLIQVSADGRADSVQVSRSSGQPVLDDAAVQAVRQWKFVPARRGDMPIPGQATQVIDFKLPQ